MAGNTLAAGSRRSQRRALLIAAVFGLLSALLVLAYLRQQRQESDARLVTVPAVFATRDIPERTQIKEGMLEIRQIPVDGRHPLAIQEKSRAAGQITRVPIAAGEQLLSSKVADQVRDVGFSGNIPEGKRALAVAVSEVVASGGHIAPGDTVDVIALYEVAVEPGVQPTPQPGKASGSLGRDQGERPKQFIAVTILQNIQVLAVARNADPNLSADGDKKSLAKVEDAHSVTLAVTPEQATKLFMSEELGKLRLSLRPFGDNEQRTIATATNSIGDLAGP